MSQIPILVTGGAGYIGSHTVAKLLEAGHSVVVLDNLSTGFHEAVPAKATFVEGDVRNSQFVENILRQHQIQSVIHFAAKLVVPESIEQPVEYYDNNLGGMISLLKAGRAAGLKHVVFSSTAAVYGDVSFEDNFGADAEGGGAAGMVTEVVTEDSMTNPLNPYGSSKLMSEQILLDCDTAFGLKNVTLRYFNVAGADESLSNGQRTKNATHLIKVAAEAALGLRPSVKIFGTDYGTKDGTGVRDYIHVSDLADLHVLALKYMQGGGRSDVFNCGYGEGFSVKEVLDMVKKVSGKDFRCEEVPRRAGDAASLVADSSKIREVFQWVPKRNQLALICRSAYEWEKKFRA